MSHADPIDLTGDSNEEAEQMEVRGASSVVFCMFLRSHRLLASASARSNHVCSFIFFPTLVEILLPLVLVTSRPNARAQRARENDAESTETWRVIDSGANERSRFVFSRSLLSRLASVRLLTLLFWFVFFSFSADNEKRIDTNTKKKNRCETYTTNPTCFLLLLLLVDVVIE